MTNRLVCGIAVFAGLILGPPAALGQDAQAAPANPSLARTFTKTIAGVLKTKVSAYLVSVPSAAASLALVAAPFDRTLTYSASCSTFLKTTFDGWARVIGQEWFLAAGAAGTYAYGSLAGKSPVAQLGVDLMEAEIVAGLTTHVLKYATQRTRPDGEEFSFPSGHAAGIFAVATVFQRHYGLKAAIPAYTIATLISGARLQANAHYPTDIIMGSAFGILAGRSATMNLASHRVQLSPAAVPGGLMITGSIQ
jgi:membrane-associated phospholipid phosphatase